MEIDPDSELLEAIKFSVLNSRYISFNIYHEIIANIVIYLEMLRFTIQSRRFATSTRKLSTAPGSLKVGYVPEHFSTPLFFAKKEGYYTDLGIEPEFVPYISGTGHMIESLKNKEIDVAVGLTEGFVAGLGKGADFYKIIGTYVQSPLDWAVSTGIGRTDLNKIADLNSPRIGISRFGSGSHVMGFVLGMQEKWAGEIHFEPLSTFKNLRESVNGGTTDIFMWEYFTSKKYYDTKEIKYIGSILTPWPSWTITARTEVASTPEVARLLEAVNQGIEYFRANQEEAFKYISTNLDYTEEDARAWAKTVRFSENVSMVDLPVLIERTADILQKAGAISVENNVDYESFVTKVKL
ncbi:hypothetical protein V1511DRAFT_165514 [Dipodascopsis uninucleata]